MGVCWGMQRGLSESWKEGHARQPPDSTSSPPGGRRGPRQASQSGKVSSLSPKESTGKRLQGAARCARIVWTARRVLHVHGPSPYARRLRAYAPARPGTPAHLLLGFELLLLQLLDLARKHGLGGRGGVDARRLDGDDKVAAVLEEVLGVQAHNARLHKKGGGWPARGCQQRTTAEMALGGRLARSSGTA